MAAGKDRYWLVVAKERPSNGSEVMKNQAILILLLCLALAASAQGYSPEYDENGRLSILRADLNRDGYFSVVDIGLFASAWLEQDCGLSNSCNGADNFPEVGDGVVDFRDFFVSAEPHGLCTDPENPDCLHVPLTLYEPPSSGGGGGGLKLLEDLEIYDGSSEDVKLDFSFPPVEVSPDAYRVYGGPSVDLEVGGGGGVGAFGTGVAYHLLVPAAEDACSYSGNLTYSLSPSVSNGGGGAPPALITVGLLGTIINPHEPASLASGGEWALPLLRGGGGFGLADTGPRAEHDVDLTDADGGGGDEGTYELFAGRLDVSETSEYIGDQIDVTWQSPYRKSPKGEAKDSVSNVHPFSGECTESAVDLRIVRRGPDFVWRRFYRSRVAPIASRVMVGTILIISILSRTVEIWFCMMASAKISITPQTQTRGLQMASLEN